MRTQRLLLIAVWLSPCLLVCLSPCPPLCRGAFDEVIDSPMYKDPDLPGPRLEPILPENAKGLWLKALNRPEADVRRQAADAVTLAHQRGATGLEIFIEPLSQALDQPDQHPAVRLAAAQALIALDARDAAPVLFRHAQTESREMRELVEPALARWDYRPARAAWLDRLGDPATPQRGLVLAIQGLAAVGEGQAADRLWEIVRSEQTAGPIRLEAARALGSLRADGLEKDAEGLAGDASPRGLLGRLAAAALLRRHKSDDAIRLLQRLADDAEPAVAAPAAARLLEIDPALLEPAVERLLASPDAELRSDAVEVLFRRPTPDRVGRLADRLDDADPAVRVKARGALLKLAADKDLKDRVIKESTRILAGTPEHWRGLEQATILLTLLEETGAAKRMVELLPTDRPEVAVTAAWGLRKLADPDTRRPVLDYVAEKRRQTLAGKSPFPSEDAPFSTVNHQVSQLIQFLGEQKYAAADPVLRQYLPRRGDQGIWDARAAAAWALGRIHEGTPEADLRDALLARLDDTSSVPPEDPRVRRMAAVSLARIKAVEVLNHLRDYCRDHEPNGDSVHDACGWAIEHLSTDPNDAMLPPKTIRPPRRDWFLTPDY